MADQNPPDDLAPIQFGKEQMSPKQEADYRRRIDSVKSNTPLSRVKGSTPLGHVERPQMPLLDRAALSGDSMPTTNSLVPGQEGVQPRPPGSPVIQPQTAAQLEQFQRAQAQAQATEEKKAEGETKKQEAEEELFELFDAFGQRLDEAARILNNKKRRQAIESRLEAMSFEDLILKGEVRQFINIIPGKFSIVLRSNSEEENIFIKAFVARNVPFRKKRDEKEAKAAEEPNSEQYMLNKIAVTQLAVALVSVNGKELPTHLDQHGEGNDELLLGKIRTLIKMSGYVIADIAIQYQWFDLRVRKLFDPEALGNG